jgi:hypothetical protein
MPIRTAAVSRSSGPRETRSRANETMKVEAADSAATDSRRFRIQTYEPSDASRPGTRSPRAFWTAVARKTGPGEGFGSGRRMRKRIALSQSPPRAIAA